MTNLCTVLQTDVGGVSADVGRKLQQVSTVEMALAAAPHSLLGTVSWHLALLCPAGAGQSIACKCDCAA